YSILGTAGGQLYFNAYDQSNDIQLYRTKGTASSSIQLTTTDDRIFSISGEFAEVSGFTYFIMITLRNNYIAWSLYQSDGTAAGTVDIYDAPKDIGIMELTTANGKLFFITSNGSGLNRTLNSYDQSDGIQQHDFFAGRDDNAYV